jgi:hypothetical protein
VPLRTEGLARSRLVKNNRLEAVLELFSAQETGSGQIAVQDLPRHYGWTEGSRHPDLAVVSALAPLPSYDVYSLRCSLRKLSIPLNDCDLRLSAEKSKQLSHYMAKFISPLLSHIYGGDHGWSSFEELVTLFKDPDEKQALTRLKLMAQKLNVSVDQIPLFIEDYGDVFLSLSYYQNCLDRLQPLLTTFTLSVKDMRKSLQVRHDAHLMAELDKIERQLAGFLAYLKHVFAEFEGMSAGLWRNLSAARFRTMQAYVHSVQTRVGGVLCGLTVKMNAWVTRFPSPSAGGPASRAEFIMSDMREGLNGILNLIRQPATADSGFRPINPVSSSSHHQPSFA